MGVLGVLSPPGVVHAGDEGEQLLFTMCWRGFVMGHRDCGPCRSWAVPEGCGAPAGLGREQAAVVTTQPPQPAALLWEEVTAQS